MQNKISPAEFKKQILKIIFEYIPKEECVVFLFGSFAQNKIYSSSDIDIGFVCDKPLGNSIIVKIKEDSEQIKTLRDIDIVDFSGIHDKDFLKIALKEIKIWHQTEKTMLYLNNLKKRIAD